MYTLARTPLQTLTTLGPQGAYHTFAQIKLADSYFFNGEHAQAAKLYDEFASTSPSSPELPYVLLQAARAYTLLARGAGRDRKPLERALQIYDTLATQNANSQYGAVAMRERAPLIEQLAAYDQGIIDFYRSVGNTAAVEVRQRAFDAQWGERLRSVHAAE
jgi:outer membrane assembly lipoprotein YfiO